MELIDVSRAWQLAKDHWGYIEDLLKAHSVDGDDICIISFHYLTAFVHGYKHGQEDLQKQGLG